MSGISGMVVGHAYSVGGAKTISVTATDQNGGTSAAATKAVSVDVVQFLPNAENPALVDLVWGGTSGIDQIQIEQFDDTIRIREVVLNGNASGAFFDYADITGRVVALGGQGDDQLDARGMLTKKVTLDGNGGNNTLYGGGAGDVLIGGVNGAEGQQGNNVIIAGNGGNTIYGNAPVGAEGSTGGNNLIVGGTGSDTIYGSYGTVKKKDGNITNGGEGGQNLIVGGGGSDTIYASQQVDGAEGGHGSILISGSTSLGQAALTSILSEWTSTRDYAVKIANISGTGSGPRNNGDNFLQAATVDDDFSVDQVFSDSAGGLNWLLYSFGQDSTSRVKNDEIETDIL